MNPLDLVDLPKWAQSALTYAGIVSFLLPIWIRASGLADRPWAKRVLAALNDVHAATRKKRPL